MSNYQCDCGAIYSHHDLMIECASNNHGLPLTGPHQLQGVTTQTVQGLQRHIKRRIEDAKYVENMIEMGEIQEGLKALRMIIADLKVMAS